LSAHPLVVIGDSLSQGFMSGAVHRTELAYPAMLARAIGGDQPFRVSDFHGAGGLPFNMEALLDELGEWAKERTDPWEWPGAFLFIRAWMDRCEDYWERGPGAEPAPIDCLPDNLSIWGAEVIDALTLTAAYCEQQILRPRDQLFAQVPEQSWHRTARRVLNPTFGPDHGHRTQLAAAAELARDGGIERLLVWLGSSNALGAINGLKIIESTRETYRLLPHERIGNLLLPRHFGDVYAELAQRVAELGAEHVFLVTVPHVTIGPSSRGVSPGGTMLTRPGSTRPYYEYYTRPWIWDDDFDPDHQPHLSGDDAMRVDGCIDAYNACINELAAKYHWHVIDVCGFMDTVAYRSNAGKPSMAWPAGLVQALQNHPELSYLVDTDAAGQPQVKLDTRFLWTTPELPHRVVKGGLYSLDGIHPTTIGYALLANRMLQKMKDVGAAPPAAELDWAAIVREDSLVRQPPAVLCDLRRWFNRLQRSKVLQVAFDAVLR